MDTQLKEKNPSFSEILREAQRRLNIYGRLELEKTTEKEYVLVLILADKVSGRVESVLEEYWNKEKTILNGRKYCPLDISILLYTNSKLCYILQDGYKIVENHVYNSEFK